MSVVRQLAEDSRAWLGRRKKMIRSFHALGLLGEPAAISAISHHLFDDDPGIAFEAAAVLEGLFATLQPELLPTLDERIRAESYYGFQSDRWRTDATGVIDRFRGVPHHSRVLGLISCHASGYVRQAAIASLDCEVHSGVEIPFLLLRLNDWVEPVRRAAEQAVKRRLSDFNRHAYLKHLSLILVLKTRTRAAESPAMVGIEDLLRADVKALVDATLVSESCRVRRYGLALALKTLNGVALESGNPLLERVLGSEDPAARLQMARWLALPARDPDFQRQLLGRLLDDPSVAVRRIALGWCATRQPNNHLPSVRAALLDQSSIIRSIAQFRIPKLESIDLRRFYREAICHAERHHLKAALGGLGEIGQSRDADLVVTFVDAPEAKIRKAALGALANLALEAHFEVFVNALQSDSPGISRQARMALDRHALHIGSERLGTIFAETLHSHVRRQTLSLINRLPKWQKLPLLIEIFGSAEASTRKTAENFLKSWLWTYNRTHHVQPTKPEIARLRQAVAAEGSKFKGRLGTELRALLQSLQ